MVLISIDFLRFYLSVYCLVVVSIEEIYQTLESVFHPISKYLKFRQKYSAPRRIFNSLFDVWKLDEKRSLRPSRLIRLQISNDSCTLATYSF